MSSLPAQQGYLRSGVTYQSLEWQFEMLSENPRTAIVTITTPEGSLEVALVEEEARRLLERLKLFLQNPQGKS